MTLDLKNLIQNKILLDYSESERNLHQNFLIQIVNGVCLEWPSGKKIRFYIRDCLALLFFGPLIGIIFVTIFNYLKGIAISSINFNLLINLWVFLVTSLIIAIIAFLVIVTLFTASLILLLMFSNINLKINPYVEMGGTESYGNMLIGIIYNSGLTLGTLPLILILLDFFRSFDDIKMKTLENSLTNIYNQSYTNITNSIATGLNQSVYHTFNEVPIKSYLNYATFILLFFFIVIIILVIIFLLHIRIKQERTREQEWLENMLDYNGVKDPGNFVNRDRYQYNLTLYQQLQNLHEWPVKKMFVVDVIISILLLFMSHWLS